MSLSQEIKEFAATFSTVSNAASAAQYRAARAEAASTPKPKDADEAGARAAGEAEKQRYDQRASAIPIGKGGASAIPIGKGGAFGVPDTLWKAQTNQESGGKQFGVDGVPLTSSKGAIGVAQVMPGTAPEAAQLAGIPYDERRYRTDPEYNIALGRAYMGKQLTDFGDPRLALAAYNAGPQRVRDAVSRHGEAWFSHMPAETQNYVSSITGKLQPRKSAIPAYAFGGLVEDATDVTEPDADTDDALEAIPTGMARPMPQPTAQPQPTAFDPMQLVSKVGGALYDGMHYIMQTFGLNDAMAGAIPGGPAQADGIRRFLSEEGAASPQDYEAVVNTVDPNRQLNEGLRNAAGLAAVHDFWLSKGDPEKAAKTAGSLLKYMRSLSARYGDEAVANLQAGRFEDAKAAINKSIDQMPDGKSVDLAMAPDGSAAVVQKDAQGRTLGQTRLSPQQLLGVAMGLKDGTLFWSTLVESAGKYDPESQTGSEAYQRAIGDLSPAPSQPPPQGMPAQQAPTTVTREGNPNAPAQQPERQAIPTPSSPPEVPMATPEQMAAMSPRERTSYLAMRNQLAQDRARQVAETGREHRADLRTQRQIDAEDRREARKQQAIPTPETRHHLSQSISQSMDDFKAGLPQGTTLPAHLEHGYKTAAFSIARDNNIDPNEAVFAADELASLNSRALANASPGENGRVRVQLRNGSQLMLDQTAYSSLRQLRAKQGEDIKQKSEKRLESDANYTRAGNMIERGVGLVAEHSAVGRAAPYAKVAAGALQDWLKSQWDEYQRSKDPRTVSLSDK